MVDLARLAPGPIGPLAGMEYVRQRGMEGQQRGQQNALSRLAGQAYNAPQADRQAIFGQMAQVDPAAAMKTEQAFQQRDTDARTELSNQARLFVGLIDKSPELAQQVYTGLAQTAQRAGFNVPPAYDPSFLDGIKTIAAQGVEGPEQFTLAPGSKRFDAAGNVIAEVDPSPVNAQVVAVPDGQGGAVQMVFDPRTRQLTMPQYNAPSAPQIEATGGPGMFAGLLSSVPGLRVTSTTRTPDQNKAAGGVDNSYHLSGQAIDIGTPTPEQRAAITQWASANGFEVIDNYRDGHVHLEPAPGRGAPQGGPRLGYTPPKDTAETELDRRIRLAREMGATDEEIRRMVIGREGAAAGAKPMPGNILKLREETIAEAETARTINTSLDKHIGAIRNGSLSFGPLQNLIAQGRNAAGASTQETRNFAEFRSDLEKLRNDSLRLNAGVQTDGDAQRAWNELFANLNDTNYVMQRLQTIRRLNERAETLKRASVERIDAEYGRAPPEAAPAAAGGSVDDLLSKYGAN